jgi:hypothetical protein
VSLLLRDYGSATPDTIIVKYRAGRVHRDDPLGASAEEDYLGTGGMSEEADKQFFEVKSFSSLDKVGEGWVHLVTHEEVADAHEVSIAWKCYWRYFDVVVCVAIAHDL